MFVPGVEVSAEATRGALHIVGLHIDQHNPSLKSTLEEVVVYRETRNQKMAKRLGELGKREGLAERGIASLRYDKRSLVHPQELATLGEDLTADAEVSGDIFGASTTFSYIGTTATGNADDGYNNYTANVGGTDYYLYHCTWEWGGATQNFAMLVMSRPWSSAWTPAAARASRATSSPTRSNCWRR